MRKRSFFLFSEYSVPEAFRVEVDAQCRRDVFSRQRAATYLTPIVFALIAISILITDPGPATFGLLSAFGVALIAAMIYWNFALKAFSRSMDKPNAGGWLGLKIGLGASTLVWGVLMAFSISETPLREHFTLIYTGAIGLTAGGTFTLSIKSSLVRIFLVCMLAPPVLTILTGNALVHPGVAGLLVLFGFGMQWLSANARAEYVIAVLNNLILQQQSEKLTLLTTVDWLTKVHNRSHFDRILEQELHRGRRIGYSLSLLMIDIDHFKAINDTYGHLVGDQCLTATAATINQCLKRETDIVSRYGGEEFCVLLQGMDHMECMAVAESIRQAVESLIVWHYGNPITVTVSIGGATVENQALTRKNLIERADTALYVAKTRGRNQVQWAPHPEA